MGALIWPVIVIVLLLLVWLLYGSKKTRDQAKRDDALPADPVARREEELAELRETHDAADPARTRHPARRP